MIGAVFSSELQGLTDRGTLCKYLWYMNQIYYRRIWFVFMAYSRIRIPPSLKRVAGSLNNVASLLRSCHRFAAAIPFCRRRTYVQTATLHRQSVIDADYVLTLEEHWSVLDWPYQLRLPRHPPACSAEVKWPRKETQSTGGLGIGILTR